MINIREYIANNTYSVYQLGGNNASSLEAVKLRDDPVAVRVREGAQAQPLKVNVRLLEVSLRGSLAPWQSFLALFGLILDSYARLWFALNDDLYAVYINFRQLWRTGKLHLERH
ncbi:hypothetical protein Trichorick_00925 [Candidatus Trichorickettsia mobilis]|uniref:Uncharacterized protein n=1 Tax=Candidatus Trichorickettsia mobilis TaxID=1346319 RepID=A0ABZ0UVB3_9RICK|nr:hypothetical protein [Candidatus Trichorickettsia mobilis]WPY01032.1 hypothetical protein Trichorick_00925 [Candidatus Trichorickettsia mobilis]